MEIRVSREKTRLVEDQERLGLYRKMVKAASRSTKAKAVEVIFVKRSNKNRERAAYATCSRSRPSYLRSLF
ncbi:hypothetical protein Q1695_015219 [Nippostrongylus brasiliensis]|nr:hypothetical protein Q1695_015219 [Nippostrongylus brasiliensis]